MFRFALAAFLPLVLLTVAALFGDIWPLIALLSITALVFALDKIVPEQKSFESDLSGTLSMALGVWHFALLALGIWAIGSGEHLASTNKALLLLGLALYFGQISFANAHELIHQGDEKSRLLGTGVYASLLFGHHVSSHTKVHHVHAGTDKDPNSAPLGLSFYPYFIKAWRGSFIKGLKAENKLRKGQKDPLPLYAHPYAQYIGMSLASMMISLILGGVLGLITLLALSTYAQAQLLLSDYVQHYGLRRRMMPNGKPEPIGPHHAWNAPQGWSGAMMLNATKHSDHHMHPAEPYTALVVDADMPVLPYSLPVMCAIALVPTKWHGLMDTDVVLRTKAMADAPLPEAAPAPAPASAAVDAPAQSETRKAADMPEAILAKTSQGDATRAKPTAPIEDAKDTGPSPYDLAMSFYEQAPDDDSSMPRGSAQLSGKPARKRWKLLERLGV